MAAVAALVPLLACAPDLATRSELDQYRALRGSLVAADTTPAGWRGRYQAFRVTLMSGTGLRATGRLLRPTPGAALGRGPFPAVLLQDGRELDSRALEYLPSEFGDVIVLSLDYPASLPSTLDLGAVLTRPRALRDAARRVPALLSLGAGYLAQRADVDSTRVAIVASSFAVPFAVIAAAVDPRIRNVALIYGAGDLERVVAANLTLRLRALRRPIAWLVTRPFTALAPERFVARIAPRPLLMVNGVDDPQMPREAVRSLYRAAREPKAIVWLRTGHLAPGDSVLIRALVDTALGRMPVLRGAPPLSRARAPVSMHPMPQSRSLHHHAHHLHGPTGRGGARVAGRSGE